MKQTVIYPLLFLLLIANYFTPTNALHAGLPPLVHNTAITVLSLLPLFAASLIFSNAFKKVENPSRALAFNLFGAVIGGLLEYAANYTGIRFLVVIAAGLYATAFLMSLREDRNSSNSD